MTVETRTLAPSRSQLVQRARPVVLQQLRERAVLQDAPAGLATRAVVALVLRAHDALDRRGAHRTGLAEAAVHGHVGAKGRDLLRKTVAGLAAQALDPLREHGARCFVEARR